MTTTQAQGTTIGFVGLGHMGGNMAARLLAAGYDVYGEARNVASLAGCGRPATGAVGSGAA